MSNSLRLIMSRISVASWVILTLYNKGVTNLKKVICTIGGGSGMPVVNRALVGAGFGNIRSVVTTMDSGGDSGRMRTDERGRILAYSDYWRSLISLWRDGEQKKIWEEMLRFRDGRGRNFGNVFFQFMAERTGDLTKVDSMFSELTGADMRGEVVPVSIKSSNICFTTRSGKKYVGEHYLDEHRMSADIVDKIWLEPKVEANEEAVRVVREAEVIIFCPGSVYGSVLVNLLPEGMIEAYKESNARKILISNIVSVSNENVRCSQRDYEDIYRRYLGAGKLFDVILMPKIECLSKTSLGKVLDWYKLERSGLLSYEVGGEVPVVAEDIIDIELENMRLRHSEDKLSRVLMSLVE